MERKHRKYSNFKSITYLSIHLRPPVTATNDGQALHSRSFPDYFTELSANYTRSTGNSTYKIIENFLKTASPPVIDSRSIINDNASGPGVCTAAVIAFLGSEPAQIEANDFFPAMVDALHRRIEVQGWKNVKATVMDSHELSYPDDTFTTTISKVNVSTHVDPFKCLQEMRRTLQPNGLVIVTIWKRFAVAELIHKAQKRVRADSEPMKVPKSEFFEESYLEDMVVKAGFGSVETRIVSATCTDDEVQSLREFMLGDFTRVVRAQWTDHEKSQWPEAIDSCIKDEIAENGGIRFDAWVVTGRK